MKGQVSYLNPDGIHQNPGFSQIVVAEGNVRTVYVGGQNAVNSQGEVVGKGNLKAQAEQIFRNLEVALGAGGAGLEDVVKWNIYILSGQSLQPGFEVFQQVWGNRPNPPVITVLYVSGLASPDFLMEMDATAVVPLE